MQNQLTKDLGSNKIYDAYMFYGDSFLVDYYIGLILEKIDPIKESTTKIYFDEYDFNFVQNRLLESSLFDPKNIVVLKIEKTIPKKELDELVEAANKNKDSYLLIGCYGDGDFKAMEANFKKTKQSFSLRCFSPNPMEALFILQDFAKKNHLQYSDDSLPHLLSFHKNDLNFCVNDIAKLAILNSEITPKVIDNYCYSMSSVHFDDLFYTMMNKRDISNELKMILESGENIIMITTQLIGAVQQICMINSYIKLHGKADLIQIIGFNPPPKIAKQKTELAMKFKTQVLINLLEHLQDVELELKSSKIDDKEGYFYSVIRGISAFL